MYKRKKRLAKKDNQVKKKILLLFFVFGALTLVGAVSYNGALVANEKYQKEEDTKMEILEEQYKEAKNKEYSEQQADALAKSEEESKKLAAEEAIKAIVEERANAENISTEETESVPVENVYVEEEISTINNNPSLPEESSNNAGMTFLGTLESTAYTHTGGNMANGEYPSVGAVACNLVPLGTKIYIEGLGYYTVKDRIGGGSQLDIFMNTEAECLNYGRRMINVYVVN